MIGIDEALYKACEDNRKLEDEIEEKDKETERLNNIVINLKNKIYGKDKYIKMLEKRNEELNNIIDELEKWLNTEIAIHIDDDLLPTIYEVILCKLQKLKENKQ